MLKDLNTGKILKTKSEVSALQDFISWLGQAKGAKEGVILICHEPERKVNHFDNNITDLPKENCCRVLFISKKHCKNI